MIIPNLLFYFKLCENIREHVPPDIYDKYLHMFDDYLILYYKHLKDNQ